MRRTKFYGIANPKMMFGTDKNLAGLIILADVLITWMTFDWKVCAGSIAVSYILVKFAQGRSKRDPWWFKMYKVYNRYADIYVPWAHKNLSERMNRPYGFGRNSKL